MTIDDVANKLVAITLADHAGDDEAAHGLEDDLYSSVLSAIAHGAPNAQALANLALRTKLLDFKRWCA